MPVRFAVAPHPANPVKVSAVSAPRKPQDVLDATWGKMAKFECDDMLQCSLQAPETWPSTQVFNGPIEGKQPAEDCSPGQYMDSVPPHKGAWDLNQLLPKSHGFIDTVKEAYDNHHHLIIRPDDVWIAILSQFNVYVNRNAETLRPYFVAHKGQKEIGVVVPAGNRYTVDFGLLATKMTEALHENILDKELKAWITPDFTTTTRHDTVISAVMMMSTLKAYFTYRTMFGCGLPSVTLEGEKEDWEKLLARIERLPMFGKETEAWAAMLRPILARFVNAFDGNPDVDFWNHICHHKSRGSGSRDLTGWISAFNVWNEHGRWRGSGETSVESILQAVKARSLTGSSEPSLVVIPPYDPERPRLMFYEWTLHLDGIAYGSIPLDKITPGYCEVNVKLDDHGEELEGMMVSGHVAARVEGGLKDTVRPLPAWFMFVKKDKQVKEALDRKGRDYTSWRPLTGRR